MTRIWLLNLCSLIGPARRPQAGGNGRVSVEAHADVRSVEGVIFDFGGLHRIDKGGLVYGLTVRERAAEIIAVDAPEEGSGVGLNRARRLVSRG